MELIYYRHNKANQKPAVINAQKINFNELTFVIKGELVYEINNTLFKLKENDAILIKRDSVRTRQNTKLCDYVSFNFTGDVADFPSKLDNCITPEIKLLFGVCDEVFDKYNNWTDKIALSLDLILKILAENISAQKKPPVIIKIERFIKANLEQKFSLKAVAAEIGYSPNYCDTIFKKQMGISIINYTIKAKIEKAKLLISENILSLPDIAFSLGFDDYNYFSRTFKKHCGYSPLKFKKNVIK